MYSIIIKTKNNVFTITVEELQGDVIDNLINQEGVIEVKIEKIRTLEMKKK